MNDINRPLRRLEVARRIQELRDKAAAEQAGTEQAGTEHTDTQHTAGPEPAPAHAVPAPDAVPTVQEDDDASAAATIASLLRGGQTWLLDRGQ